MSDVLSRRALGRATLARQLLLARAEMPILAAVEHLVGLQAQVPQNPYVALWSRLDGFRPEELARLLVDRQVVRIVILRATLHLVTADDALVLRPLTQPVLDRELARHREYAPLLDGVEIGAVLDFARDLLAEQSRTGTQLRAALQERFPDQDAPALAYACRNHLALVQVPPRGVWGRTAQVTSTTLESWVGRPLATHASIDDLVVRYLAAFGPATTADVTTWSRLTGLAEVVERLRPRLRAFRDEDGRALVDLPDAPRPDPDTPAPVRFLPEYDNVLLSHADRSRFVIERARTQVLGSPAPVHGAVLYDGGVCGTWRLERGPGPVARMVVNHVDPLAKRARAAVASEGRRLLRFLAGAVEGDEVGEVRLEPLG